MLFRLVEEALFESNWFTLRYQDSKGTKRVKFAYAKDKNDAVKYLLKTDSAAKNVKVTDNMTQDYRSVSGFNPDDCVTQLNRDFRHWAHKKSVAKVPDNSVLHHVNGNEYDEKFSNLVEIPMSQCASKKEQTFVHHALHLLRLKTNKSSDTQSFLLNSFDSKGSPITRQLTVSLR